MDVDNTDIDLIACKFRTMNTNDKDHLINEFKRLSNTQLGTEGCCFYLDLAEWNLNSALWAYYEYETAAAANNLNNGVVSGQYGVIGSGGGGDGGVSVDQNEMYSAHGHGGLSNVNEMPEMQFVCDITIGEGESVAPNTNFLKTWRIKNTGTNRWPSGCTLKYVNGYNFSSSLSSYSSPSSSSSSSSTSSSSDLLTNNNISPLDPSQPPVEIDLPELDPQESADISMSLRSPRHCGIYQCQYRTYTRLQQPFGDPIWLLLNVEEGGVLGITQQLNSVNVFGAGAQFSNNNINNNNSRAHVDPSELLGISNKTTPFHIDSNSNLVNSRLRTTTDKQQDEKRPDFYDDMFS